MRVSSNDWRPHSNPVLHNGKSTSGVSGDDIDDGDAEWCDDDDDDGDDADDDDDNDNDDDDGGDDDDDNDDDDVADDGDEVGDIDHNDGDHDIITEARSNQDLIWCVKMGYIWVFGYIVGPDYYGSP